MSKTAKKNRDLDKLSTEEVLARKDELLKRLAKALRNLPKKPESEKKFRYGHHFHTALRLFEILSKDAYILAETVDYLEGHRRKDKSLLTLFRAGCVASFDHVAGKLEDHVTDLAHVHSLKDVEDVDKEYYHNAIRRLTTLKRRTGAMYLVEVDDATQRDSNVYINSHAPRIDQLKRIFDPMKGPAQMQPRRRSRHSQLYLASQQAQRHSRRAAHG